MTVGVRHPPCVGLFAGDPRRISERGRPARGGAQQMSHITVDDVRRSSAVPPVLRVQRVSRTSVDEGEFVIIDPIRLGKVTLLNLIGTLMQPAAP